MKRCAQIADAGLRRRRGAGRAEQRRRPAGAGHRAPKARPAKAQPAGAATVPVRRSWPTWGSARCACSAPAPQVGLAGYRPGRRRVRSGGRHALELTRPAPTADLSRPCPPCSKATCAPAAGARFAIIASRWNPRITDVAGGWRAPRAGRQWRGRRRGRRDSRARAPGNCRRRRARRWPRAGNMSAIIALGCVVRGDTRHYEHVADECADGLMRVSLDYRLPVANGVLAVERARGCRSARRRQPRQQGRGSRTRGDRNGATCMEQIAIERPTA